MNDTGPRPLTKMLALASSIAVVAIAGIALWTYLGNDGGDPPATRSAIIAPVRSAVDAAAAHSEACAKGFTDIARAGGTTSAAFDARKDTLAQCGKEARRLAEKGYAALNTATGPGDSPRRNQFLDSAGSMLSVYEMQGDDFDVIYDLLRDARTDSTLAATLGSDVNDMVGSAASDIAAAQQQLTRTQDSYREGG